MAQVEVFETEAEKFPWLRARIDGMLAKGQVVIFAKSKQSAQDSPLQITIAFRVRSVFFPSPGDSWCKICLKMCNMSDQTAQM